MDIGSAINQGLIGLQNSQASIAQSAQQIAQAGATPKAGAQNAAAPNANVQDNELVEPLVNLKIQSQLFDANAKVIKSADETLGTLINTKA